MELGTKEDKGSTSTGTKATLEALAAPVYQSLLQGTLVSTFFNSSAGQSDKQC